jgi:UDP-N-acetylmuramoylalanine--D-glutamate ligase
MGQAVSRELIASSNFPLIVGLGSTGLSCARYYQRKGIPFAVIDSRQQPPGLAALQAASPQAQLALGSIDLQQLLQADRLVISPGVALSEPAIAQALEQGVPHCGDIDLFVAEARAPVVGITGSNGKSTVTALLGRMAARAGMNVAVGGNLGTPALDLLADDVELYVLELSSFQLERAGRLELALACVLNMSADHLDRHGDMQEYHRAKHRVFAGCKGLVYNHDDLLTRPLQADALPAWEFGLGEPDLNGFGVCDLAGEEWLCQGVTSLMRTAELRLLGHHNIANALAALALGSALELPMQEMLAELQEFGGLPHRSQWIADIDGVHYINDSKATNPGATEAALSGLVADSPLLLIAGGQGKGADFSDLCDSIARCCKAVVLIGEAAPQLQSLIADAVPLVAALDMEAAVRAAADMAQAGDTVLLSPACASFDMFSGFAQRGDAFVAAVKSLGTRDDCRE